MRVLWILVGVFGLLLSSGCSFRHPTYLTESDLAIATRDSVSLEEFLALPDEEQIERTERAEKALAPLSAVEAAQFALDQLLSAPLVHTPYQVYRRLPPLGDVIDHLDAALGLDPTRADLWLVRGRLLDIAGDQRRARESLEVAWMVANSVPDKQADLVTVRRGIALTSAWLERDAGWWDNGLTWLDRASSDLDDDDAEAVLLRGLLLAGRGDLEDAMALSYGMPAVELPVVSQMGKEGFLGLKKQKSDLLRRWLQAEVWMRRGRDDLAWSVLGEIPYWRRITALPHRFYQDIGLYAEVSGSTPSANLYYALAFLRREYRQAVQPVPLTCDPVISGLPHRDLNFYRLAAGTFHGGSLSAYAMSTTMLALDRAGTEAGERSYVLAQEALETCLRRGMHPDESLALRGRLRFSRGHYVLAEMDLVAARAGFADRGGVEPWTSYLLGLIAMGRDRPDEAVSFLEESLAVDGELGGAWDALGVARLQQGDREQARLAFDRALEVDPQSSMSFFNRGLLRSQEGDLDGGLADFEAAANLDPENMQFGRVIQLARLAKREGRAFMPGLDAVGRWTPAGVDVQAHEGGAFAPRTLAGQDMWQSRVGEMFDEIVAEQGREVRAAGLDATELVQLIGIHDLDPTPINRKILAHAFVWLELPDEARALLATHWGGDLDEDEVLLLLWLDQRAGEEQRLQQMAHRMGEDVALEVDRFGWAALATRILNEHRNPLVGKQGTLTKADVSNRSTSYGSGYVVWLSKQHFRMKNGLGDRDGNMLVDPRGRSYALGRGGKVVGRGIGETGGAGNAKVRSLTAGKR